MSLGTLTAHDLTLSDLNRVYNLLFQVRAKWKDIGLQLGVNVNSLDNIQSEVSYRDDGQRLMQMLSEWLRNVTEPRPSWPRVVDALRSEPVRDGKLADKVKKRHCPGYIEPRPSVSFPPRQTDDPSGESQRSSSLEPSPKRRSSSLKPPPKPKKWQYGLLLVGIVLSIVFAAGGIALITVGIIGLSDDDSCSIGPHDTLNSFNLLSGIASLSGIVLVTLFVILWFCGKENKCAVKAMIGTIIGFIAFSIVFSIGDMIYSFYVASQVLPNVEKWENNTTLCDEAVFRSSFGVIVIFFLILFAILTAGASLLSYWVFKKIIHTKPVANCIESFGE